MSRRKFTATIERPKVRADVHFRPKLRKDGRYAIELYLPPGHGIGCLHWIESATRMVVRCSAADLVTHSWILIEETEAMCDELKRMYDENELATLYRWADERLA